MSDSKDLASNEEQEPDYCRKIKLVYGGFARSGTASLKQALQRLGYNACHGFDIMGNIMGSHGNLTLAIIQQDVQQILKETTLAGDYNATLELHGLYWREIRQVCPSTKFLLVIRDYRKWEHSVSTLYAAVQPLFRYPLRLLPPIDRAFQLTASQVMYSIPSITTLQQARQHMWHPNDPKNVEARKQVYLEFVQDAQQFAQAQPHRALVYYLGEGYQPLCDFLNITTNCPTEDFPHVNSAMSVRMLYSMFNVLEVVMIGLAILIPMGVVRFVWTKQRNKTTAITEPTKKRD